MYISNASALQHFKGVKSMQSKSFRGILQNFMMMMEGFPNTLGPDCDSALEEPCLFLNIGRITADYYANLKDEIEGNSEKYTLFDSEDVEMQNVHNVEKRTPVGTVIVYHVYAKKGYMSWDEEELVRIDILIKMLFVFNGRTKLQLANYRLSFYDPDMEVYNLKFFFKTLSEVIRHGEINEYAALYINLRHFSAVNLQLGRSLGNVVMRRYIGYINDMFTGNEHIARIGGDNFAILVKQSNLENVLEALAGTAITYDDKTHDRILVSASAGVYIITDTIPVHSPTEIMDRISVAIAIAKRNNHNAQENFAFFDTAMMKENERVLRISSLFPSAIENEEFIVYYQPKVSVDECRLVGAEALCRWEHDGRLISPAEFIPVLERGIDICKLDFYMLDHVCRDIRRWLDEGRSVVKVSVNLSRRHLSDMDLLQHIVEIVDRNNVPHEYIEVELTETTTDVEFKDLKRVISGLQEVGIATSVDDFGIGYSSLTLIKDIPWNVLKVDRSFLPEHGENYDAKKEVMLRYVVGMAQGMGLECVAEGVETLEQIKLLMDCKCDIVQGFYFDRPMPVDEFVTRLDNYKYEIK